MTEPRWIVLKRLRIAIDGPSGSGKGTVSAMLGKELGLPVFDTGLLYRFVAAYALEHAIPFEEEALIHAVNGLMRRLRWDTEGIFFDGVNWSPRLREEVVGKMATNVAAMPKLRASLLHLQRSYAQDSCVMDGRDIGTVVLPDAEAKFFLTASPRERARRRWAQLRRMGCEVSLDDVFTELRKRDRRDEDREHAPLKMAPGAMRIDSTTMRVDEVVERMLIVLERRGLIRRAEES